MLPLHRRGTHGFVQLALDTRTNTRMAIKFIPRDQKMQTKSVLRYINPPMPCHPCNHWGKAWLAVCRGCYRQLKALRCPSIA